MGTPSNVLGVRRWSHRLATSRRDDGRLLAGVVGVLVVGAVALGTTIASIASPVTEALGRTVARSTEVVAGGAGLDIRSKIYAADGTLIAILHGEENREPVPLARVPAGLRLAVIATEDERFYQHRGVDPNALMRALLVDTTAQGLEQGGGTITMQLARNAYLHDHERTFARKLEEIAIARRLEAARSKDQILEEYLNTVYFGEGAYGVQAAAETYFDRTVDRLTLGQAALLVGLIRSPELLDPRTHASAALARRRFVLDRMVRAHMLPAAKAAESAREPVQLASRAVSNGVVMVADAGASFVGYVKDLLLADPRLGATPAERRDRLFNGGLRITTTLDLAAQRAAERAIAGVLDQPDDPSAALASVDPANGAIRAMAGGKDARGFNLASQGRRQPGSAFKPFTLVAALEKGESVYRGYNGSAPRTIDIPGGTPWVVHNYEGSAGGYLSILRATELSVNAVYAQMVMDVGPAAVVDVAHRMGITSHLDAYPSIALGALTYGVSPLELADAYATLANGGLHVAPYAIATVQGRDGKIVFSTKPSVRRVLAPDIANKARAVLEKVVQDGTGRRALALDRPAAGKTGTTDDYRDSWFVGFTPQLSTAVWLGYPKVARPLYDIHGMPKVFGGSLPCEIWTEMMRDALAEQPVLAFAAVDLGGGSVRRSATPRTGGDLLRLRRHGHKG